MADSDVVRVAREQVNAFSSGDWARMRGLLAADGVYDEPATGRHVQGADQIVQALEGWKQAFPDATGTITNALGSGNTAVLEITWEGTQTGPLAGPAGTIPASGKVAKVQAVQVLTVEDGKVKDTRHYFDMMGLLQQIGALPR